MRIVPALVSLSVASTLACEQPPKPPMTAEQPPGPSAAQALAGSASPEQAPSAPAAAVDSLDEPKLRQPQDPDEACAWIIAASFKGAEEAPEAVNRDEAAARKRAEALRAKVVSGADFRELADDESDARSKIRRGAIGTFTRDRWPEKHAAIADAVFALKVNEVSPVVKAPYGYTFAKRCKVEKVHTRHVLIRYAGALRAPEKVTRSREQAEALAIEIYSEAQAGTPVAELARKYSEDSSAERGGDMGSVGRGLFVPPYEEAAFALKPGAISAPVESDFGFHVIERVK